ncbi:MAG TPA: arginine--tRNA ligase [Treponemataceae bacterium]|jgi:arginyl-tRNA synthetase|nr:arginine--tRNA ligase [Treponemataceae bacterium]HOS34536.1 arginine--tRNA ligase [Treponemataceae bacterium]HOU38453.1 arginine--tRNA ligase [Treponemataceae bacterium]HPL91112.1 arginine--tRNA ligase [Treponemataceae bacterium]HQF72959.1 arginine--tRNA ligase [Treponemataceae bacterium]
MSDIRETWRVAVASALESLRQEKDLPGDPVDAGTLSAEVPPNPAMGDVGFPLFPFAKVFRMAPPALAAEVSARLAADDALAQFGTVKAVGPYVNVFLAKGAVAGKTLTDIIGSGDGWGRSDALAGRRVMVEFSSPNTNKPLHLGHLRNDALGESISRILAFCGAEVFKVNIVNNRGIHICKSMLAYQKFFAGETPESRGVKSDRFVGDCYVRFNEYSKTEPEKAEAEAQDLLRAWEAGDPEVMRLWKQMNGWAEEGITQTYARTGVSFDKIYYESETYMKGREEILAGLDKGLFYREEDGSVWVDLEPIGLDKKVLLRKDGTALYMTQDVGTAIYRHTDWDFNQLVYVVGSEQQYHFKVLFYVLRLLGYDWAENLYHLSYGMVNLPEGKMKSREGTVVDGDDLINTLRDGALEEISAKGRDEAVGDPAAVAEKIALGALHYFLLQVSPTKDMIFNPKESLAFTGNTGPYLQYMGARISSILRKVADDPSLAGGSVQAGLLTHDAEWGLLKILGEFPKQTLRAAQNQDPSVITGYIYDLSKAFSRFYHDCPILAAGSPDLARTRLELVRACRIVLKNALDLVLVPFLESM